MSQEAINPADIAVRSFDKHCGYCTLVAQDLLILAGVANDGQKRVDKLSIKCPSCGMVWQFVIGTFLLYQVNDGDNYWQPTE